MEIPAHRPARRFTLATLFVLVAIFGLAFATISPAVNAARESARKMSCSNNLKQLGLAIHTYHDTYQQLPRNGLYFTTAQSNNPYVGARTSRGSVFVKLGFYFANHPFPNSLSFELAGDEWGFGEQQAVIGVGGRRGPAVWGKAKTFYYHTLICPSANLDIWLDGPRDSSPAISCYAPSMGSQRMVSPGNWCDDYRGNNFGTAPVPSALTTEPEYVSGVFAKGHWAATFRDIVDGQSQVIAFGEILPHRDVHQRLGWVHANAFPAATTAPINFPVIGLGEKGFPGDKNCHHYANSQTSNGFRSRHKGGIQIVMCDGSTQFINEDIDYLTYQRLGDRRDGQPLNGQWKPIAAQ